MEKFDLVCLTINSQRFAMPKKAAMAFFEACCNAEIYKIDSHWSSGKGSELHAWALTQEDMPSISAMNPVQFHVALEAKRVYDEERGK